MARLLLASRGIPNLADLAAARGTDAVLVPTAANELAEPEIADEVEAELGANGFAVRRLDLDRVQPAEAHALWTGADVIAVCGGDPFQLLAAARRALFGETLRGALAREAVYIGYSAGATLVAPTLEPLVMTSPFSPPDGMDLSGLGLVDVLVLPHDDRPGRRRRHEAAMRAFGSRLALAPLADGDVLVHDHGVTSIIRRRRSARRSAPDDERRR